MWIYFFALGLAWLAWIIYSKIWKPLTLLSFYKKQLAHKPYRVHFAKFIPFLSEIMTKVYYDTKNHNDAYYTEKRQSKDLDLLYCNFGKDVMMIIINPTLIKELYALDGGSTYKKQEDIIHNIKRLVGESITFSHGERWKKKRKFMTTFLNFNHVNK